MINKDPEISLIIPVFNEEELAGALCERALSAMRAITEDFEIIFVDDGSEDGTLALIRQFREKDARVKILLLSRNFGHQAAYSAGLAYAKGKYIAMMDGDLQDPPELIPEMYRKLLSEGRDVVYGKRNRRAEVFIKKWFISLFHAIFKRLSHIHYDETVGNFSIFNRRVQAAILSMNESSRYLPGLRFFVGFDQAPFEYDRPDRQVGSSKMSGSHLFQLALDAIFSFSAIPIKVCLYAGLAGILMTLGATAYALFSKITGIAPFGWSSTVLSIYFLGSVQLVFLGILGEYIFRIYRETQARPKYFVRDFLD